LNIRTACSLEQDARSNNMLARTDSNRDMQIETANRNGRASSCVVDAFNPTQKHATHRYKPANGLFSGALGEHRKPLPRW